MSFSLQITNARTLILVTANCSTSGSSGTKGSYIKKFRRIRRMFALLQSDAGRAATKRRLSTALPNLRQLQLLWKIGLRGGFKRRWRRRSGKHRYSRQDIRDHRLNPYIVPVHTLLGSNRGSRSSLLRHAGMGGGQTQPRVGSCLFFRRLFVACIVVLPYMHRRRKVVPVVENRCLAVPSVYSILAPFPVPSSIAPLPVSDSSRPVISPSSLFSRRRRRSSPSIEAGSSERRIAPFDHWFTWCQTCRHGGHANHMERWFRLVFY